VPATATAASFAGVACASNAFAVAPYFASDDERQCRAFNPVTAATLRGKGAALLPTTLVPCRFSMLSLLLPSFHPSPLPSFCALGSLLPEEKVT
jgi:hypothetical protein